MNNIEQSSYLSTLVCLPGYSWMLRLLIDSGLDVNTDGLIFNLLGLAAEAGQRENVSLLIERGANSSLALSQFMTYTETLQEHVYEELLQTLLENSRPFAAMEIQSNDPLLALIWIPRNLPWQFYPRKITAMLQKAPSILLSRGVAPREFISGGKETRKEVISLRNSYLYRAIIHEAPSMINPLLQYGISAEGAIGDYFIRDCNEQGSHSKDTWLTLAVRVGAASCARVLIENGADVTALDRNHRSAAQIAISNAAVLLYYCPVPEICDGHCVHPTAEKWKETLDVIRNAFDLKYHGSISMEDYVLSIQNSDTALKQNAAEKAIQAVSTPSQLDYRQAHLGAVADQIKQLWSLTFLEALLVRFFYVLSYMLLPILAVHAFMRGEKPLPIPSRRTVIGITLLMLGVVLGFSKGN